MTMNPLAFLADDQPGGRGHLTVSYVEFKSTGHPSVHLAAFVQAAKRAALDWHVDAWVRRAFLTDHHDLVRDLREDSTNGLSVSFQCVEDLASFSFPEDRPIPSDAQFEIARRCAQASNARVCYLASLDQCVSDLALGHRSEDISYTGTLLYPYLHYPFYPLHRGKMGFPLHRRKWPSNPWVCAKSFLLHFLMCRRGDVPRILTIDPLAVDWYNRALLTRKFSYLPDYVDRASPSPDGRVRLQLPAGRVVFGFLGVINGRKGAIQFLTAVERGLQRDRTLGSLAAFLFAGVVMEDAREQFYATVSRLGREYPGTPIVVLDRFLSAQDFVTCVDVSDVVCIPYPRHVGLSSLLLHASAYGKPVIGPEFGTVGELIRRFGLGAQCDPTNADALAATIWEMARKAPLMEEAERLRLRGLVADRSLESFGDHMVRAVEAVHCQNRA